MQRAHGIKWVRSKTKSNGEEINQIDSAGERRCKNSEGLRWRKTKSDGFRQGTSASQVKQNALEGS